MQCTQLNVNRHFGGTYHLQFHDGKIRHARCQQEAGSWPCKPTVVCSVWLLALYPRRQKVLQPEITLSFSMLNFIKSQGEVRIWNMQKREGKAGQTFKWPAVTSFSKPKLQITDLFDPLWNAVRWVGWATTSHKDQPHRAQGGNYVKFPGFSYINQSYDQPTTKRPKFHWITKSSDFIRLPEDSTISQNVYALHINKFGGRGYFTQGRDVCV